MMILLMPPPYPSGAGPRYQRIASSLILDELRPNERLLFSGDVACAGTFACGVNDPLFGGGLPSTAHCLVFSRTPVWIQHEGGARYVADPTLVTFHNRGRAYRRWRIGDAGDRCDWLAYADDVLDDVAARWMPERADSDGAVPFPRQFVPVPPQLYLRQRRFFQQMISGSADPLEVEEGAVDLLTSVTVHASTYRDDLQRRRASRQEFAAIQCVRETIAARPDTAHSLRHLARTVEMSPYQLCRAFKREFGDTLTAYRRRLRLLSSLDAVYAGEDLTAIALAYGFSSHSHFTAEFRRAFGDVPSQLRSARSRNR
jgi:AraC-like DNA-binding protein